MSVWICIPSIRPNGGTLPKWKELGYKVAVLRQGDALRWPDIELLTTDYLGWAASINLLVREVLASDSEAEWMIGGGDDTEPDLAHTPENIADECMAESRERAGCPFAGTPSGSGDSFLVMQPVGDYALWPGSNILGFAGSPWMGREWCRRAYLGNGPMYEGYRHNWSDQELQEVAIKYGVFWQRHDLVHQHNHVGRCGGSWKWEPFQSPLNAPELWAKEKAHFEERRATGFPCSEPLSA